MECLRNVLCCGLCSNPRPPPRAVIEWYTCPIMTLCIFTIYAFGAAAFMTSQNEEDSLTYKVLLYICLAFVGVFLLLLVVRAYNKRVPLPHYLRHPPVSRREFSPMGTRLPYDWNDPTVSAFDKDLARAFARIEKEGEAKLRKAEAAARKAGPLPSTSGSIEQAADVHVESRHGQRPSTSQSCQDIPLDEDYTRPPDPSTGAIRKTPSKVHKSKGKSKSAEFLPVAEQDSSYTVESPEGTDKLTRQDSTDDLNEITVIEFEESSDTPAKKPMRLKFEMDYESPEKSIFQKFRALFKFKESYPKKNRYTNKRSCTNDKTTQTTFSESSTNDQF